MKLSSNRGYSLVEMLIVMVIFSVVIVMVGTSFSTLLKYSSGAAKREESNIEGNVGLEVMRRDISSAGFGLPTSYNISGAPVYAEAKNAPASTLNDGSSASKIPRALAATYNLAATSDSSAGVSYTTVANSDYLAIKATSVGKDPAAQKWTYAGYSDTPPVPPRSWTTGAVHNPQSAVPNLSNGDVVIALDRSTTATDAGYDLLKDAGTGNYWTSFSPAGLPAAFSAISQQDTVFIYGIAGSGTTPRMPFNRVDYFVARPDSAALMPNYCAPNTGILYRGQVKHGPGVDAGTLEYQPVLDCVAGMRVVLGWNLLDSTGSLVTDAGKTGSGAIDTWTNASGGNLRSSYTGSTPALNDAYMSALAMNPAQLRTKLKVVKVYLLVQIGKKDTSYTSPSPINLYANDESSTTPSGTVSTYTLAPEMLNYRWKVYKLVIRPKNLTSNQ